MVRPKTEEEIELLRINGELVSKTLAEVGKWVAPGVTTEKLNEVAETFIRDHGAIPSFKGFEGFPAALCISVNDVVVHGFSVRLRPQGGRHRVRGLRNPVQRL
jgi:Methionine aminopeptidase